MSNILKRIQKKKAQTKRRKKNTRGIKKGIKQLSSLVSVSGGRGSRVNSRTDPIVAVQTKNERHLVAPAPPEEKKEKETEEKTDAD